MGEGRISVQQSGEMGCLGKRENRELKGV